MMPMSRGEVARLQRLNCLQYMRPKEWEPMGETRKRERSVALAKRQADRQAEEEERKAKRQQRQSAAAKRVCTGVGYA